MRIDLSSALVRWGRDFFAGVANTWSQLWFQSAPTTPLDVARIGLGAAMLVHYTLATPYLFELWGDDGWMPRAAALEFTRIWTSTEYTNSILFYFTAPWQWVAFHALFMACCFAFMVGWRTSWVKWIVLAGQISYDYRNQALTYGVDQILACLLFILCMAPAGRSLSLDRVRAVRAAKRENLDAIVPPYTSPWGGACTRLMQIQIAILFFFTGAAKVHGNDWWGGDAIWLTFVTNDFYNQFLLDLFARHYWLVNVATYSTILIQVAFPFLIWQQSTRPYMLAAAEFLHLSFAVLLGLFYFSFVMMMGHMSFVRPEWLARLGAWWKRKIGDMEIVYDGRCESCVRRMASLLAYDGLSQIGIRNFRVNPSLLVGDDRAENALHLVVPDGRALSGFEAYRYIVVRVPGLWWIAPLVHIPILSRLFVKPIYEWVTAQRSHYSSEAPLVGAANRIRAKP